MLFVLNSIPTPSEPFPVFVVISTTPAAALEPYSAAAAGPFSTHLGNGSVVDYVWYRFVDQPAISRLGLSDEQKAGLQAWAESLHDQGTDGLTIPPPTSGQLVSLDSELIVTPPPGLSRGYVPIAIGQRESTNKVFSSGFEAPEE